MSEKNLKEIISELLRLGYEGTYWDFKEDYTDCREDKLIDIICMANNIDGHQAYLIYGADDNGNVKGIEKTKYSRYTTKSVTEFLRSKPFAGDYIPKATVQTLEIENHELDIVIIKNTNNTPYYLTEAYSPSHDVKKKLYAGAIYTRVNDINTPRIQTANIEHTEFLWRKRFGIDLSPSQKLLHLLEHTEDWSETTWDSDSNVTKLSQNTPLHSKLSCNGALFCVFSKKHLTNMQFRAAILLSTLSKMALVVRSVSRHKNYKEDYL